MENRWRVYWIRIEFNTCGDLSVAIQRLWQPEPGMGYKHRMYSLKNKPASLARLLRVMSGKPMIDACKWKRDSYLESDAWNTDCDNSFILMEGTPTENSMIYCPYCGKRIEEIS